MVSVIARHYTSEAVWCSKEASELLPNVGVSGEKGMKKQLLFAETSARVVWS